MKVMHTDHRINCHTFVRVDCPRLGLIEMGVAAVNWEVSVSKSSTTAIEGISITVFTFFESVRVEMMIMK